MDFDRQMIDWGSQFGRPIHVLLTKSDKLSRGKAKSTLLSARREAGADVTIQLFSAVDGTGVEEARDRLAAMLESPGG